MNVLTVWLHTDNNPANLSLAPTAVNMKARSGRVPRIAEAMV